MATKRKPPPRPRTPFTRTSKLHATLTTTKTSTDPPKKSAPTRDPITPKPKATAAVERAPSVSLTHGPSAPIPTSPKALHAELLRLVDDVANNFYRIGTCLRVAKQTEAHRELGFPSFKALVESLEQGTRFQAHRLIEVATVLPEPVALGLGLSRAYHTIRLVTRTHPGQSPADVIAADPAVHVYDGEPPVALSALNVKMLESAKRKLAGKSVPGQRRAQTAARALGQVFGHAGIDPSRVRSRLTSSGWQVSIDLPPDEAEALAQLLSRKKR